MSLLLTVLMLETEYSGFGGQCLWSNLEELGVKSAGTYTQQNTTKHNLFKFVEYILDAFH